MSGHDCIVLGGGISGIGVALALLRAKRTVTVLDQGSCHSATSNNSLRIIHGGLRYLQQFDLLRIVSSISAQDRLLAEYPEFIKPLNCIMPLAASGLRSKYPVRAACLTYGLISRAVAKSDRLLPKVISVESVRSILTNMGDLAPHGALSWQDGLITDPTAFGNHLVSQVRSLGGSVIEHTRATNVTRVAKGMKVSYVDSQGESELSGKVVINCLGPWIESIERPSQPKYSANHGWAKAFNIVIKRQIEPNYALGFSRAGRSFFMLPRGEGSAIGTWYEPLTDRSNEVKVTEPELTRFISELNLALPELRISAVEVIAVDLGVLPTWGVLNGEPRLYGSEQIKSIPGYVEVLSTKYTTFIGQGQRVARVVEAMCVD